MKIKHWQGYGTVNATRIKDTGCTLHVRVSGNHECGLERDDPFDLYWWLVKRFDKRVPDTYMDWYMEARRKYDSVCKVTDTYANGTEICDYRFFY